jgi:hypothetical protein
MIFSLIFAIFGLGSGGNTLVPEQPPMPCPPNRTSGAPMGSSWTYQLAVPSTLPLHQGYHDILLDFGYFWL